MSNATFCELAARFYSNKIIPINQKILHACTVQVLSLLHKAQLVFGMGLKFGLNCHMGAKYRLKCSRGDRGRNGTGADNMNWCLGKQIRCRIWLEMSLGRSKGRLKDNIKMDVK
jgi:hypothetical protein